MPHPPQKTKIGRKSLFEATKFIQEIITDSAVWGPDVTASRQQLLENAQAGDQTAIAKGKDMVMELLTDYGVEVEDHSIREAAEKIFAYAWGLDVLEQYYWDPEVDEIRVNSPTSIFIQRRGRNEKVDTRFRDEEHVKKIASRLFIHDRGVALTASTPVVESIRADGTRVTATCPPATRDWTMVLRKHGTFKMTRENLIKGQTLNEELFDLLSYLVRGRANILFSGGTGTGKTSLVRFLLGLVDERLRIVTLENDMELRLKEAYPARDIVEMEEHLELGLTMSRQFRTILRYSPDIIIVGEIRGRGEAVEAVKACTRGHDGSMATIHFGSPVDAVEGFGKMMLEEGLNLPLDVANLWVAQAFNIVVQMFTDTRRGIKKITSVTEIKTSGHQIEYIDLALWQPDKNENDYFKGRWVFPNDPSPELTARMARYFQPSPARARALV